MFSRLNVRTKLLVMLLPAVLGLCGLAGLGVKTRLDDRGAAQRHRDASTVAAKGADLVHELQRERLAAATAAAVPTDSARADVTVQAGITDDAVASLSSAIDGLGGDLGDADTVTNAIDTLRRNLGTVDSTRSSAEGATTGEIAETYSGLIDSTMAAVGSLELADDAGGSGAVSRRWLAEGIEAESAAAATATGLFLDGSARTDAGAGAEELTKRAQVFYDTYSEYAGTDGAEALRDAHSNTAAASSDVYFNEMAAGAKAFTADPATWASVVAGRLDPVVDVERASYRSDIAALVTAADDADSSAIYFGAGAAGSCLLVVLLAFGVSRYIAVALGRLTEAAREISQEQVPALVRSLKSGATDSLAVRFTEVETGSGDEFDEVGSALNDLGRAVVTVASEQQQSLRKGISEIFVNLARRNQTLLDRQIQFIDRLESNEQDPDQLENLFRLDHLATRMRRNAESLLVLAGAEAPRRRARDVELTDVIRVAVGEVEDFARISLMAVEEAHAVGSAAVDIAHLLAELMENGAQYSPPERTVDVIGHRTAEGGYVISIGDHGVGMDAERLDAANRLLASPPPVGLALSRSLGFVVAGTLANRHGIRVHLAASPSGGVTAEVTIPASLILAPEPVAPEAPSVPVPSASLPTIVEPAPTPSGEPTFDRAPAWVPETPAFGPPAFDPAAFETTSFDSTPSFVAEPAFSAPPAPPAPVEPAAETPVVAGWTADGEYVEVGIGSVSWSEERLPTAPAPSKLVDMLPEGPAFEQGLYSLLERDVPPTEPAAPTTPAAPSSAIAPPTGSGAPELPRRERGATTAPKESPQDRTTAPQRAPDEVRSVLSRYRSGLDTGRQGPAVPKPTVPNPTDQNVVPPAVPPTDHDPGASPR
jgi:signal transduction histidine kinase